MNKKISFSDFENDLSREDDIFLEINAAGNSSENVDGKSLSALISATATIISAISSLVSASDPGNTFTESC